MPSIDFIAKPIRERPAHSTEDINSYEVRYHPTRGLVHGTTGFRDFSNLLLEAICGLPEHNAQKDPIRVSLQGDFPQKYVDEAHTVFDLYARAEGVEVHFQ